MKQLKIKIKYANDDTTRLSKIERGNWIDLYADKTVFISKGDFGFIPLGIAMQLPDGYEANIVPRSSTFKNFKIIQSNHYGVIDNSYCGDNDWWGFGAIALKNTVIEKGSKICQFRINRIQPTFDFEEVEILGNPSRGGFGSTGKT